MSARGNAGKNGSRMGAITRAISIRQPDVEQILRGVKVREYRSVPTNIRERVYIYASKHRGNWFEYDLLGFEPEDLPRGLLVGTVEITGCEWFPQGDCYAYLLKNPKRIARPLEPANQPQPIWFRPF